MHTRPPHWEAVLASTPTETRTQPDHRPQGRGPGRGRRGAICADTAVVLLLMFRGRKELSPFLRQAAGIILFKSGYKNQHLHICPCPHYSRLSENGGIC